MIPGKYTVQGCSDLNKKRLSLSLYKNTAKAKKKRKGLRGSRYKKDDAHEEKEGKLFYEPGGF